MRNKKAFYTIAICLICLMLAPPLLNKAHVFSEVHAVSCFSGNAVIPTGYATGPSSGTTGQSVTLTSTITGCRSQGTANGAFIVAWTFGDGTTARTQSNNGIQSVSHTYNSAGLFTWSISLSTDPNSIGPPDPPGTDSPQSLTINVGAGTYNQHIEPGLSVFAASYNLKGTGQSYIHFNAYVPPMVRAATVTVQFTDNGDQYTRVFDVLVNGNEITPNTGCASNSQGMCIGSGQPPWTSNDITGIVANNNHVDVGVKITTYTGSWTIWAFLSLSVRYEPWPDGDARWGNTDHPMTQAHLNLYDTTGILANHFLAAPSMEIKASENQQNPVVELGVTGHIPDWVQSDYQKQVSGYIGMAITNDIHLYITDQSGTTLGNDVYNVVNAYASPNNSGSDYASTGSDLLAIIAAVASALPGGQYAAVPASIASVLVKYLPPTFSYGKDTSGPGGVHLNDHNEVGSDLSDMLQLTLHFSSPGTYTFHASTTTAIRLAQEICGFFGCSFYETTLSSQTVYYQTTYVY